MDFKKLFLLTCFIVGSVCFLSRHSKTTAVVFERQGVAFKHKTSTYAEAVNNIQRKDVEKDVRYLCSDELEGRGTGFKGNKLAAAFIKQRFESLGLKTTYQKFPINIQAEDDYSNNVIAWIDGKEKPDEIVVVSCHLDHLGKRGDVIYYGADDNASGTAGLMAVAKAYSMLKEKVKRTVVFIAFSGEEIGLVGSAYYVRHPLFPLKNPSIKSCIQDIQMDMISRLKENVYISSGKDINTKYPFGADITSHGPGSSDHDSFYRMGVPVTFLFTGMHPQYHKPTDKPDLCNFDGLALVSKYCFEYSWQIVQNGVRPDDRFAQAEGDFKRIVSFPFQVIDGSLRHLSLAP